MPRAGSASSAGFEPRADRSRPPRVDRGARAPSTARRSVSCVLAPERLHDQGAVDALVRDRGDLADLLLRAARRPFHPPGEAVVHERERREEQEPDQREEWVGAR